jgi:plastocyanin
VKFLVLGAAAALLVTLACGSEKSASTSPSATSTAPSGQTAPAPATPTTVQVTIAGFAFQPATITIPAGKPVVFAVTNKDTTAHTFSFNLPGQGYNVILEGSQSKTGDTFTPAAAGKLTFFCQYHANMEGTLEITAE